MNKSYENIHDIGGVIMNNTSHIKNKLFPGCDKTPNATGQPVSDQAAVQKKRFLILKEKVLPLYESFLHLQPVNGNDVYINRMRECYEQFKTNCNGVNFCRLYEDVELYYYGNRKILQLIEDMDATVEEMQPSEDPHEVLTEITQNYLFFLRRSLDDLESSYRERFKSYQMIPKGLDPADVSLFIRQECAETMIADLPDRYDALRELLGNRSAALSDKEFLGFCENYHMLSHIKKSPVDFDVVILRLSERKVSIEKTAIKRKRLYDRIFEVLSAEKIDALDPKVHPDLVDLTTSQIKERYIEFLAECKTELTSIYQR